MFQTIIVILLLIGAVVYIGTMIYRNFTKKSGCASGCGKCGVDFQSIERQLEKKKI